MLHLVNLGSYYRNVPKFSYRQVWATSVDPDQTAGSTLFVIPSAYHKNLKYSDTQNICCNHPNIWTRWLYRRVMHPKDAAGIANSVEPDQTAPLGAVWSLFAQTYLSENLGSLR